jgi:phage host-nuclease inhibitor protein Gam
LCEHPNALDDVAVEAPISHRDVTTIMALLGDIRHEVIRIRRALEEENGEEEAAEDDA